MTAWPIVPAVPSRRGTSAARRAYPRQVTPLLRILAALIAGLGCQLVAAPAAHGKDGVHATLERPEQLRHAAAGERIALAWRLSDASGRPFGASGIYLRLRAAAGGGAHVVPARAAGSAGRYVADLTIPSGGIGSLAVGLEGVRLVPGHAPVRADMLFPIANDPFVATGAQAGAGPPWGALAVLVALAALATLSAGYRVSSARRAIG